MINKHGILHDKNVKFSVLSGRTEVTPPPIPTLGDQCNDQRDRWSGVGLKRSSGVGSQQRNRMFSVNSEVCRTPKIPDVRSFGPVQLCTKNDNYISVRTLLPWRSEPSPYQVGQIPRNDVEGGRLILVGEIHDVERTRKCV